MPKDRQLPRGLPVLPETADAPGPLELGRRDFLSMMGFSLAAAGLAACRAPVQKAIPLLVGSDQIVPGVASYYATTCGGCPSVCGLLVKQRDGRPIKVEGNAKSRLFGGGTCATGQATVLSLYDDERLRGPRWRGEPLTWEQMDERVLALLRATPGNARRVVLLSGTITSPSTRQIIAGWSARVPGFSHVVYDAVSLSAMREANALSFGRAVVPHFRFDRASAVVALEADFLGTWLSPVEFARQYARSRRRGPAPLHVQFESGLSVTGSNADVRVPVAPSRLGAVAVALLVRIARRAGMEDVPAQPDPVDRRTLDELAQQLWSRRGRSLVVSGLQDVPVQMVVNALNSLLGNVGRTVDLDRPSLQRQGDDRAMARLVDDMNRGAVRALMVYGANPAYDYPDADRFVSGLSQVALSVSFADRRDETAALVDASCPDHHFLEAWSDAEPVESHYSLAQPLIAPLFDTRAAQESLRRWLGEEKPNHYDYLRQFWRRELFRRARRRGDFDAFWDRSLRNGAVVLAARGRRRPARLQGGWRAEAQAIAAEQARASSSGPDGEGRYELSLYESVALRDGRHANNPWLQELPDPISKATWGNYAAASPALAARLGLSDGDVVSLGSQGAQIELPVLVQPGQEARTISVALGYGRKQVGKVGQGVGSNAFPLVARAGGHFRHWASGVSLARTGRRAPLAMAQTHFSTEGRPVALERARGELAPPAESEPEEGRDLLPTLWAERPRGEHAWGMIIDTDACTGCSACVVACQSENNVPVVGRDQVLRGRIMHWIRVDHYYSGPEDNPRSLHQPMMCQHCGNAPCETVCPVLATTTSSEGLNQQVYNRCIGTRYCANNCPYKVRRFNWYDYAQGADFGFNMKSPLGRMALNPDVAVRSRGVMEKCSLCVQRIEAAKNRAMQERRELAEGDVQTACQQACPTQAIVFGDLKSPESRVSLLRRGGRHYQVLEELGTRPSVGYLEKIRRRREG